MKRPELQMPGLHQKVVRQQVREAQPSTRVSTSHEVELQGHLNARIDDLMNQIQITNDSMNIRNQGLAQKLQTSHFELSRAQAGVSHLRTSLERNQSTENRDAGGKKIIPWVGKIFRNRPRLKDLFSAKKHKWKRRVLNSMGGRAKYVELLELRCRKMHPIGVASGDTSLLVAAHTAGDTSQSTLRNFSVASAVSSSVLGLSPPRLGGSLCREMNTFNLEEQEKYFRSYQSGEDPAQNSLNKSQTTQRLPSTGEPPSVATAGRSLVVS